MKDFAADTGSGAGTAGGADTAAGDTGTVGDTAAGGADTAGAVWDTSWSGPETTGETGDAGDTAGPSAVGGVWDTSWSGPETGPGAETGAGTGTETGRGVGDAADTGHAGDTGHAPGAGLARQELGQRSEDLAASFVRDVEGHELLTIHTEGSRPQGLDLETLGPDGRVHVIEVKGTAARDYRPPRMTRNVGGTQMSREWVVSTLNRDGQTHLEGVDAVGEGPDQVGRSVIQVDERGGTVSVWEHVGDDGRLDTSGGPDRVYSLADVRDVQRAGR